VAHMTLNLPPFWETWLVLTTTEAANMRLSGRIFTRLSWLSLVVKELSALNASDEARLAVTVDPVTGRRAGRAARARTSSETRDG
jgi:hypothetical protein